MTRPHPIPVDALEATHLLVVGTTGSGKTYLLRGLIEQLRRADRRIGAIDKLGKLWGLTLSADGAAPGLDFVVFGGKRQPNVPMAPADGGRIARLFVERNLPAIFDLSQWTAFDQEAWVADFATELFLANEAALHLAIDEAQSFVPVNGGGPAFNAVRRLAEQGRGNGVNLMLTAPRLSRVDATVRGAMQGIVAMRQTGTNDRVATAELLAGEAAIDEKALKAELPGLATGTGIVWVPGARRLERLAFPANATFDSSRTPRHGDRPPAPIAVSSTLVDELRAALAPAAGDTPRPNDVTPADPAAVYPRGSEAGEALAECERRVAELEVENAALRAEVAAHRAAGTELRAGVGTAQEMLQAASAAAAALVSTEAIDRAGRAAAADADDLETSSGGAGAGGATAPSTLGAGRGARAPLRRGNDGRVARGTTGAQFEEASTTSVAGASDQPDREYRALAGLAAVHPAGLSEAAWAARTGYSRKGGAWIRRRKRYADAGLIEARDNRWFATAAGVAAAGAEIPDMPPPGFALVRWWSVRLGAPGRILELLAAVHPRALTRDAIAAETRMSAGGGAFNRHVSALKAAELVVETKRRLACAPHLLGEA